LFKKIIKLNKESRTLNVEFKLKILEQMTLHIETPALLFSATSLILLAYTNRFLTIAQIIRKLKKTYDEEENKSVLLEIKNLDLRLSLIRYMQMFGVLCLFLSVFAMLLLFMEQQISSIYLFGLSLLALLISLGISFWEISISIDALRLHLSDLTYTKEKNNSVVGEK
jgi:hypothetical protein